MAEAAPTTTGTWLRSEGPLGSSIRTLVGATPDEVLRVVDEHAEECRRMWYDVRAGVVQFMAPTSSHELLSRGTDDLVMALCAAAGVAVEWRGHTTVAGEDRAADPDQSYFIGAKAERFGALVSRAGRDAAIEAMEHVPPDLVVEAEHAHRAELKPALYAEAGVVELWEVATGRWERAPAIYDLQADGGPRIVATSRVLPGLRADCLPNAVAEVRALGGLVGVGRRLAHDPTVAERLRRAAGMPVGTLPSDPEGSKQD